MMEDPIITQQAESIKLIGKPVINYEIIKNLESLNNDFKDKYGGLCGHAWNSRGTARRATPQADNL